MVADQRVGANLSWLDVEELTGRIAVRVTAEDLPEVVVGVLRGGMVPAVMLAHQLGVRDVRAVEVTRTLADGIDADKSTQPCVRNPASIGDLAGRDVLIVDDIAGAGATAAFTRRLLRAQRPHRVRTAVVTVNRLNWRGPDPPDRALDYIGHVYEGWVIFPWEAR